MPIKLTGPGDAFVPERPQQRYTDADRPVGVRSVLRGRQVVWAGPSWRWQSVPQFERLKRTGKLNRSILSDPIGVIGNELSFIGKQIAATNARGGGGQRLRGSFLDRVGQVFTRQGREAARILGSPAPAITALAAPFGQAGRNASAALTVGAAENAAKLAIAATQKAKGRKANPETSRPGNFVEQVTDLSYRALGATPPAQQTEFERGLDATVRSVGTAAAGTAAAVPIVPAIGTGAAGALITGGARWALGEVLSTFADDNRGGNLSNLAEAATGAKLPLSVDAGEDDWLDSAVKSLIPNALPGIALSGLGAGVARLNSTRRWLRESRTVAERTADRKALEQAGVTQNDPTTGATTWQEAEAEFTQRFGLNEQQPDPAPTPPAAPTQAAPTAPAEAPVSGGSLEVDGVDIDPSDLIYDPALPEADVVLGLVRNLDDEQLQQLMASPDPVVPQLEEMLATVEAAPARPDLEMGRVFAPAGSVAERIGHKGQPLSYAQTLQSMPLATLRNVAAPENAPDLARLITSFTGRDWEEFTKADIVEGLDRYQAESGLSLLVRDWGQNMRPTAEIAADPQRFQFKQGTNAAGEQIGNSLSGVSRWDTVAEGTIDVWTDPADGRTYVVNGHNRLARAQQLGIPTIPVRELPAATAQEARALGALANIKEGHGTVFDAAKFMRDSNITSPDQLERMGAPMRDGHAAKGLALAQLPDNLFQAAVEGRLSVGKAAALGGSGLDEQGMQAAFKAIGERDMTDAKFAEVIQQVQTTPRMKVDDGQTKLPWDDEEPLLLMEQKADLVVKIRQDLLKDKRFFSTTVKGSDRLTEAGNRINVEGNKAIAADTEMVLRTFDQLKYAAGPVGDLLNEGAKAIAEGAKPSVIAARIRDEVANAVRQSLEQQGLPVQRPAGTAARAAGAAASTAEGAATSEADALFAQAEELLAGMSANTGKMAEMSRRMLETSAGIEDINGGRISDQVVPSPRLTPEQRQALQIDLIRRAVDGAEVRPPETPLPALPDGPTVKVDEAAAELDGSRGRPAPGTTAAQAIADEMRLGAEFYDRDQEMRAIVEEGLRDAAGYELKTFEEKKALGLTDGYDRPAADLSTAPPGWDSVEPTPVSDFKQLSWTQERLADTIRMVAGEDVYIRFNKEYQSVTLPKEWGGDGVERAASAGSYNFVQDLITINGLGRADYITLTEVAYHEAFHRLQYVALGEKEAKVLDSALARLKIGIGSGHAQITNRAISYSESQAVAFQKYAIAKRKGEDPVAALLGQYFPADSGRDKVIAQVISLFDRILDFSEKMYNLIRYGTYDSVKGIFERSRQGSLSGQDLSGDNGSGFNRMFATDAAGVSWKGTSWDYQRVGNSGGGVNASLAPAPVRPEPMQLADGPPASADTRGQGVFYHGAANEFELTNGGEFGGDGMNIYGDGFYATDDLTTAAKYQKKNRKNAPSGAAPVVYRVIENEPVKLYDLDKPVTKATLNKLRKSTGRSGLDLLEQAIEEAGESASLAEIMDEMRAWSREFNMPAYEVQEVFQGFAEALEKDGFGGYTHVGGNLAGGGKRNHQVRIYWDPAERITIEKVDPLMTGPRPKVADDAARRQIEANNQRIQQLRDQAQKEGC